MRASLVPPGMVSSVIPALLPYLAESEKWSKGRASVDDILRFVLNQQMQLWVVHEENTIYGHVVTEIKEYPKCKMLVVQYCAGEPDHMQYVDDEIFDLLDRFAKDTGCSGIEFVGRPGWRKQAEKYGFEVRSVMYQKFFKEET
jgi:hypothetical protein